MAIEPHQVIWQHVHFTYELVYTLAGGARLVLGPQDFLELREGEVALVPPIFRRCQRQNGPSATQLGYLAILPAALTAEQIALLDTAPDSLPASPLLVRYHELGMAVREQLPFEQERPPRRGHGPMPLQSALIPLTISALMAYIEDAHARGLVREPPRRHPLVEMVRETVRRRLDEPLSLADLAEAGHVSREHLVRLFRRETGVTPGRYLWSERLRAALHLLQHTRLPVGEVANRAGFRAPEHLGRAVRAATGLTPTGIRARADAVHTAAADTAAARLVPGSPHGLRDIG